MASDGLQGLAAAAIAYARLGYSILPLRPRDKRPSQPWATAQQHAASPEEVATIWRSNGHQDANIAVATGAVSGVIVIDLDGDEGNAELDWRELPLHPIVSQTARGRHLWFQYPAGWRVPNSVRILPGVDVRGDGGYVVVPPSIHPSGAVYVWADGAIPDRLTLPKLPAWLLDLLNGHLDDAAQNTASSASNPGAHRKLSRATLEFATHGADVGTRNDRLFRAACDYAGCGYSQAEAESALMRVGRQSGLRTEEISTTLASAYARPRASAIPDAPVESRAARAKRGPSDTTTKPDTDTRPEIVLSTDIPRVVDAAQAALMTDPDVYQRAGMIVHVVPSPPDLGGIHRAAAAPIIANAAPAALRERMARQASWRKASVETGELRACMPPPWVAETLLERRAWPFRPLRAIITAPTLREDGSLLATPGYDGASALIYRPTHNGISGVPDAPTIDHAVEAVEVLAEPFGQFRWREDVPGSALASVLAAILTLLCRHAIPGPVPMWAISSPVRGSGKTLLADCIAIVGTGRSAARITQPQDEEEMRKRIMALALAADPVVCIDNVERDIRSGALAAAITGDSVRDRLLGRSEMVTAPWTSLVLVTGNNLMLRGDITRRTLVVTIDPRMEWPEDRAGWTHGDLRAYITEQRPSLITAALTTMRAWITAGRPQPQAVPWGSFERWSETIRAAITWALVDPCSGRERTRSEDPDREEHLALLDALAAVAYDPESALTAEQLCATAETDLRLVLLALCGGEKRLDARTLGYRLRRYNGRIAEGRQLAAFRQVGLAAQPTRWYVTSI